MSRYDDQQHDINPSDVPGDNASDDELWDFAASLNGYEIVGGVHECGQIAMDPDHNSVTELRIAQFFTTRALRHSGQDFDDSTRDQFRRYNARIRQLLELEQG